MGSKLNVTSNGFNSGSCDDLLATKDCGIIAAGQITSAKGHFTNFELVIDNFAQAKPESRSFVEFENRNNGIETTCDILIDLTERTPLFPGWQKRDGYFRASLSDAKALSAVERSVLDLIGSFEKPIYVKFDENLCAHSRNKIAGCSRCINVCPAGAIKSDGDHVKIDPAICGGCGLCGSVSLGQLNRHPRPIYSRIASLLEDYQGGGKSAVYLSTTTIWTRDDRDGCPSWSGHSSECNTNQYTFNW